VRKTVRAAGLSRLPGCKSVCAETYSGPTCGQT